MARGRHPGDSYARYRGTTPLARSRRPYRRSAPLQTSCDGLTRSVLLNTVPKHLGASYRRRSSESSPVMAGSTPLNLTPVNLTPANRDATCRARAAVVGP
ncbi:hypothetical protein NY08_714 [Rhodococcus sp. B7740]|nr:hypothetical protein NY08_714 [Rhodococcus sp. B7740]